MECPSSEERWTYVELIQLGPHAGGGDALHLLGQQDLSDGVDDAQLVGAKVGREGGAVHLGCLAVCLIMHALALVAEAGGLAVLLQVGKVELAFLVGDGEDDLAATTPRGVPAQGKGGRGCDGVCVYGRVAGGVGLLVGLVGSS